MQLGPFRFIFGTPNFLVKGTQFAKWLLDKGTSNRYKGEKVKKSCRGSICATSSCSDCITQTKP